MLSPQKRTAYIQLHISVFLWGFTAILGKLILLREAPLIWHRTWITCVGLLFLPGVIRNLRKISWKEIIKLSGIGCLIGAHWLCFYGSIKYANVSVALSALATVSLFASIIEPIILKKPFKVYEILLGLIVVPAIMLIFHFTYYYTTGIILGLLAALGSAIFTTFNKKMVAKHETGSITFIELSAAFIFISIIMPFYLKLFPGTRLLPTAMDWVYIIILSLFCTIVPFMLSLKSLRHLSAFTATLSVNLEPIYGIIMAIFLFHEDRELNWQFYAGTLMIIAAVFIHPFLIKRFEKSAPQGSD
ncbi:MAG: DMT family transporter [Bacteroidetes bacterium]|nr:DMT family transporter [Bacteroidota bacterium]